MITETSIPCPRCGKDCECAVGHLRSDGTWGCETAEARCGYQPEDLRYAPCTRPPHSEGPCAHPLAVRTSRPFTIPSAPARPGVACFDGCSPQAGGVGLSLQELLNEFPALKRMREELLTALEKEYRRGYEDGQSDERDSWNSHGPQ